MYEILLLCGKPGCGKTTLAHYLEKEYGMVSFSADDYMLKLYGEVEDRAEFEKKLALVKEMICSLAIKFLSKKVKVVIDFGLWTKSERESLKQVFSNFKTAIIYLNKSDEEIFKNLDKRNANLKENEYFIDRETFKILSSKFEEPQICEGVLNFSSSHLSDVKKILE